jgi:hypothetical protein
VTNKFYVYTYTDPETNVIFYVGKGCGYRARDGLNRYHRTRCKNPLKQSVIEKVLARGQVVQVDYLATDLSETDAMVLEGKEIESRGLRIEGKGPLVNLIKGGGGRSGRIWSPEKKEQIRQSNLGQCRSEETKKLLSQRAREKFAAMTVEERKAIAAKRKPRTTETIASSVAKTKATKAANRLLLIAKSNTTLT